MTKEELEKEARAKYKTGSYPQLHPDHFAFIHGYLAGAEPREKRIEELEKENKTLEGCLLAEQEYTQMLEQQIEKMKCCANCEKYFVNCKMEDVTEEEYLRANAFCKHWKLRR
jgi:hypothetical protein